MNNDLAVRTRTCRRKPSEYDSRPAERVEIGVASGSLQDIREFRGSVAYDLTGCRDESLESMAAEFLGGGTRHTWVIPLFAK